MANPPLPAAYTCAGSQYGNRRALLAAAGVEQGGARALTIATTGGSACFYKCGAVGCAQTCNCLFGATGACAVACALPALACARATRWP